MPPTLRCDNLWKSFDGTLGLSGFSLSMAPSGLTAIIGPNGAGKTTLLNVIMGFLRPDQGRVYLGAVDLTQVSPHQITRMGIARTFQDLRLINLISVLGNVMLARQNQRGERLGWALTRIGVRGEERANRKRAIELLEFIGLPEKANDPVGSLSYGQQKLLTLACCMATEAHILLLDEPVAGVQPEMVKKILGLLRELRGQGKLIVFVEHDLLAVRQVADCVVVMDQGRIIAEGPPADVLERPEIIEAYIA